MCRCSVSGWNATVIDPFPIDAGRCRKTGHLCLQGGFIWSEGWWIDQSQTVLWNWEEQFRKKSISSNWIPAPINTNLIFLIKKKSVQLRLHPVYSLIEPLPKLKKKTKKKNKQNKQNTTTTETEPIFLHTKKHTKKSVGFLFERTSWSVERRRSAMPWPFRCTGHPRVSHKHPRPWYVSCRSGRNHVVVVVVFLEGVEMK